MNKDLKQVKEFHLTSGHPIRETPQLIPRAEAALTVRLIKEELSELEDAIIVDDLLEVADALTDIQYLVNGAFLRFGLAGLKEKLFDEVQRSNMSKFCTTKEEAEKAVDDATTQDGSQWYYESVGRKYVLYRNSDDKIMKGPNYSKPNLNTILDENK